MQKIAHNMQKIANNMRKIAYNMQILAQNMQKIANNMQCPYACLYNIDDVTPFECSIIMVVKI